MTLPTRLVLSLVLLAATLPCGRAWAKAKPSGPAAAASAAPASSAAAAGSASGPGNPSSPPAGAAPTSTTSPPPPGTCVDTVPTGVRRPEVRSEFPARGTSGYASVLRIVVEHGKGESVLPRGLELQGESEGAKALREAGFVIPDQDGGSAAHLAPSVPQPAAADRASTTLDLPLLALPKEPGRTVLTLPAFPVSIARASGEVMTVCTPPHKMMVEDPISSTPDPQPKPNPPGRPQREEWTALRRGTQWLAAGLLLGGLLAYGLYRWSKRPKPIPPPPPPRVPWDVALEQLDEVRHAGLIEVGRFGEYFDRVSDTMRRYLGARYGFDGLESTTDEILQALEKAHLAGVTIPELSVFLKDCDLVKFANLTPSPEDCARVLDASERIVRSTMPRPRVFAEGQATQ